MRAMRIHVLGPLSEENRPLVAEVIPVPVPGHHELLVRVMACGVCHTELDEIEGRTPPLELPMTPGHQVVGEVVRQGDGCSLGLQGKRIGVAWIHHACGECDSCRKGLENLCPGFMATGRDAPGGYAGFMVVPEAFTYEIPDEIPSAEATPLLCAGAVGYRALRLCKLSDREALGLTGFGASGHLVLQMARYLYPNSPICVFARNVGEREFALEMGAHWAGDTVDSPPQSLNAIIDTTPAWLPVLSALESLAPGGRLVINAIRKESGDREVLNRLDYEHHLWHEKSVLSVANVTRRDVRECLRLAAEIPLKPHVTKFGLEQANQALVELKNGHIRGAKVLCMD